MNNTLPRGVTVALQILDLFVMVRIHARQPIPLRFLVICIFSAR